MSGAQQRDLSPESWDLGDRFLLEQGFAVAFLGWQFDVQPSQGLTFQAPVAPVEGLVRETHIEANGGRTIDLVLAYCAIDPRQQNATLTFRASMDAAPRPIPRDRWRFADDGCSVRLSTDAGVGIYEVVYQAKGSPVAGLGLAAIRDFASYLRYGADGATLRETPGALQRIIGYGYSQSGRFLREFVRDGFNADERGRPAFDALMISSAGAGGGSFNHRFAMPGVAGNSVLSVLRPVDLPPFTDEGLLARPEQRGSRRRSSTRSRPPSTGRAPDPSPIRATTAGRTRRLRRHRASISWRGRRIRPGSCRWSRARVGRRSSTSPTSPSSVGFHARSSSISMRGPRNESEPPSSQYPSSRRASWWRSKTSIFQTRRRFRSPATCRKCGGWTTDRDYATTKVITMEPPRIWVRPIASSCLK